MLRTGKASSLSGPSFLSCTLHPASCTLHQARHFPARRPSGRHSGGIGRL